MIMASYMAELRLLVTHPYVMKSVTAYDIHLLPLVTVLSQVPRAHLL